MESKYYCRKEEIEEIHQEEQKESAIERGGGKMILFNEPVKEIKGPLAELIKDNRKAEHHREFE